VTDTAKGHRARSSPFLFGGIIVTFRTDGPLLHLSRSENMLDGRIDDPGAGWKGRALWSTYATRAPFHVEGGKGTRSKVLKFQLRPDPLAR